VTKISEVILEVAAVAPWVKFALLLARLLPRRAGDRVAKWAFERGVILRLAGCRELARSGDIDQLAAAHRRSGLNCVEKLL
jgi:hypothetical protein